MALTPEQQEEFDALKNWWKKNGLSVIATFAITASVIFGWKSWQNYQINQQEQASIAFEALSAIPEGQQSEPPLSSEKIKQFIQTHKGSGYEALAQLLAAKAYVDQNDLSQAETHLRLAMEHTDLAQIKEIAQLRLGRVLLHQDKYDEALALALRPHDAAFAGFYAELRGDIFQAQGDLENAKNNYLEAADHAEVDLSLLSLKISEVGGRLN